MEKLKNYWAKITEINVKQQVEKLFNAGGVHIFVGSFLTKFMTFFGSIVIVRVLSKDEYGLLAYIENLYSFAYLIAGFGLSNAILRYVVLERTLIGKRRVFDYSSQTAFIFNFILVILCIVLSRFYPFSAGFLEAKDLIPIIMIMLPAQYFVENELALERAMLNNKKYAFFSFGIAICTILYKFTGAIIEGVKGVLFCGVFANIVLGSVFYVIGYRKYFKGIPKDKLKKTDKKEINRYSVQYMVTNGIWTLFMLIDIFMLGQLLENAELVADYKVAYAWPANLSIICVSIGIFVAPYFIKNENDKEWVKKNFITTFILNFGVVFLIGAVMFILAKPLIYIYGGREYYNIIPLMRILIISAVVNNGFRYVIANILAAMGKIKYNMVVSILGIILQIVLNLIFIPSVGVYGSAYSSICSYTMMAVMLLFIFKKKYL